MPDNCGIVHSWCNHRVKEHPRLLVGCTPCAFRDSRDGECEFGALFRGMLYMLCEAELHIEDDPQVPCFLRWLDCCARFLTAITIYYPGYFLLSSTIPHQNLVKWDFTC